MTLYTHCVRKESSHVIMGQIRIELGNSDMTRNRGVSPTKRNIFSTLVAYRPRKHGTRFSIHAGKRYGETI